MIDPAAAMTFLNDLGAQLGPSTGTVVVVPGQATPSAGALTRQLDAGARGLVRFNILDFGQAVCGQALRAESLAAAALGEQPSTGGSLPWTIGKREAQMRALPKSAIRDYYMAVFGILRWLPKAIDVPRGNDAIYVQGPIAPHIGGAPSLLNSPQAIQGAIIVAAGVVGVAAAAAAAISYWAGKREDRIAAVDIGTVRAVSAAEQAGAAIVAQVAQGKAPDPALVAVLSRVGAAEESRGWSGYAAAALAGTTVALGTVAAYQVTK